MTRRETSTAEQVKRDQILRAAELEFQENGFAVTNMDRISSRAGVSKRTVYKYFESKEKLFRALIRGHWAKFAKSLEVRYEKNRDIREQLVELGQAEGCLLTSPEVMATTRMVMSEVLRSPKLVEENQEKTDFKASFEEMLREAANDGQLCVEDPRQAAEEFISLIKGKAFWPVVFGAPVVTRQEMDELIENSVEMIMSRYGS